MEGGQRDDTDEKADCRGGEEALGQLKLSRRLSNEADDWTKGGESRTGSTAGGTAWVETD